MRDNYYRVWKLFNEFFIKLDLKPNTWEERIVLFVGHLIDTDHQSSMIRSYISAIKNVLRDDGEILDENMYLLKSLTRACRIHNDRVKIRLPITKNVLKLILNALQNLFAKQPFLLTLYSALFTTMYVGLFRIGEVTLSQHMVKAVDVHSV